MKTALLTDGRFEAAPGIPLSDRGFRYGMSVFETIAIRAGRPLLLDLHLARLAESAAAAGLRPPAWEAPARAALLAPPITEGAVRLYLTAGDDDAGPGRAALLFEAMTLPTELGAAHATLVPFTPATPFGKTGNYWPHFLARPADGTEAILHRPDGTLLGGAMANLVLVREGRLLTPAHPTRRGVVCDWLEAVPASLTLADLASADEAFLTNSRVGLLALTAIGGNGPYASAKTRSLWLRYRTEVLGA